MNGAREPSQDRSQQSVSRLARLAGATLERLHRSARGRAEDAERVRLLATRLWEAALAGHVCIDLAREDASRLAASPVVAVALSGTGQGQLPGLFHEQALVLDGCKLYAQRFWAAETRLAAALRAHARPAPLAAAAAVEAVLERIFGAASGAGPDLQRSAVAHALGHGLLLLSGGPGTGKTTTLARLVRAVRELAPTARIAVAAPTGKAATRAAQAIAAEVGDAVADGAASAGLTLHRLLGSHGPGRGFRHGPDDPLPYDLVIIDEASMIDLEMADTLLAALTTTTRLVLAGDRHQLASVEPGAVFAAACEIASGPVAHSGITLERNWRQQDAPQIVGLAAAIRGGQGPAALAACHGEIVLHADGGRTVRRPAAATAGRIAAHAARYHEALWDRLSREGTVHDEAALDTRGIELLRLATSLGLLCVLREGPLGAVRLAAEVDVRARRALQVADARTWYAGRLIIVRRNFPDLGLFNGEIGICLGLRDQLVGVFERAGSTLAVPVLQLPPCDDAWALTVHQAQGSEFETVLLVPAPAGHRLATRESLYTGVTRARSRVEIYGEADALAWASEHPTVRDGDLSRRLGSRYD